MQLFKVHGAVYAADVEDEEFLAFKCAAHIIDRFAIRVDQSQSGKDEVDKPPSG